MSPQLDRGDFVSFVSITLPLTEEKTERGQGFKAGKVLEYFPVLQ